MTTRENRGDAMVDQSSRTLEELIVPVYAEDITVQRRRIANDTVRVSIRTRTREHLVDEQVTRERVRIERIAVGRYVDSIPAVREEGDLTIMPVVEEVVVVERRLLLREEVHIRRVRTTEQHIETVQLREQDATITRAPATASTPQTTKSSPPTVDLET